MATTVISQCTCTYSRNNSEADAIATRTLISKSSMDSGYCSPKSGLESPNVERTTEDITLLFNSNRSRELTDDELVELVKCGVVPLHALEKLLADYPRAIRIRRSIVSPEASLCLDALQLPYEGYDFSDVVGRCAENIIRYMPLPVGVAGPVKVNGVSIYLPMATTEGALIASTSRGCKAINGGGGLRTVVTSDSMTRAPVVSFENIQKAAGAKRYIESIDGQACLREAFNSTTNFGRLKDVVVKMAGRTLYLRFSASTGDAMGMNMIGKATEAALHSLLDLDEFVDMKIVSLSGNYCTDKKPAAINWILGRGKSVIAEAVIPADVVQRVLKCSVPGLVQLNTSKNLVGSALAGMSTGATGQDPAQNVVSSNCLTLMEELHDGSLYITVTMPSIEVGTIGGGTGLAPQRAMLDMIGVKRIEELSDGSSAASLASIVAGGVLAGELSLCAALVAGDLIKSHMKYNRKA